MSKRSTIAPTRRTALTAGAVAIAASLFATSCRMPSVPLRASLVLEDARLRCEFVAQTDGDNALELSARSASGSDLCRVARATGVRLVSVAADGSREVLTVPFVACRLDEAGQLRIEPARAGEHSIEVRCRLGASGEVRVEVESKVALRSRFHELALDWQFIDEPDADAHDDEDADFEFASPHPHPSRDDLAGDLSFHAPIAFVRRGTRALALTPDLDLLARERRVAQGIEVRPAAGGVDPFVRHGLMTQRLVHRGAGVSRFTRREVDPIELRSETVRFAHHVQVFADAEPDRTLAGLYDDLWRRYAAKALLTSPPQAPLTPWADVARDVLARSIRPSWRDLGDPLGDLDALGGGGIYASEPTPAADAAGAAFETHFEVTRQALRTAFVDLRLAAASADLDGGRVRAERALQLALTAPRRSGMVPGWLSIGDGGSRAWLPHRGHGPIAPEQLHAFDAACTGLWLLVLGDELPNLGRSTLELAGELARFFAQNQRADGSIPAFYQPDFLTPRRDIFDDASPESGGPALFLVEYGKRATGRAASDAIECARRALEHLAARTTGPVWPDFEILAADPAGAPRPQRGTRATLAAIFATRAAFAIAETTAEQAGADSMVAIGERFCSYVAAMQQVWSPPWVPVDLQGGVRANDASIRYSDPRQALAADAFVAAYLATGRRDWLQRASLALRSGLRFAASGWTPERGLLPEYPDWGRSTTLAIIERIRGRVGQGVVHVARDPIDGSLRAFAEGLDAIWFEDLRIDAARIEFRLLSEVRHGAPCRIVFRGLPADLVSLAVYVNGEPAGIHDAARLRAGLELVPRRVARLEFAPPRRIRHAAPFAPRASTTLRPVVGTTTEIVYRPVTTIDGTPRVPDRIPLVWNEDGTLTTREPKPMTLPVGTTIEAWLEQSSPDGRRVVVPADGPRLILIDTMDCIDPGDDDGHFLLDAGASTVVRDPNGREFARAIPAGLSITFRVPIPPEATSLELAIAVHGAMRVTTGQQLLHVDEAAAPDAREVRIRIADPRLWRADGQMPLTIHAGVHGACIVARIRHLATGTAAQVVAGTEAEVVRAPDARLHIAVVPVEFADAPFVFGGKDFERVFFGGDDYRVTPKPNARTTSGSVARLIQRASGGLSELRGTVTPAQRASGPRDAASLTAALRALDESFALDAFDDPLDAIVAVVSGAASPMPAPPSIEVAGREVSLVLVPEISADGSILTSGLALVRLLARLYDLEDLGLPENGNFGEFAISAGPGSHTPGDLAGPNVVRTGWADVSRIDPLALGPDRSIAVAVAPLDRGRNVLRLPCDVVPGRGDLYLETRTPSTGEPWRSGNGALAYWVAAEGATPRVFRRDGSRAEPRILRLSPVRRRFETPFVPATSDDLLRDVSALDGDSSPTLATLRGDVVWAFRQVQTRGGDGSVEVWLEYLPRDLLRSQHVESTAWLSIGTEGEAANVTTLLHQDLTPSLRIDPVDRSIAIAPDPASVVRGRFSLEPDARPWRLVGEISCRERQGRVRIAVQGQPSIQMTIDGDDNRFELDLPAASVPLHVDFDFEGSAEHDGPQPQYRLERLAVLPRTEGALPVRLAEVATSTRLTDGVVYGSTGLIALDRRGQATQAMPVLIPASGRASLRIVAALERGASGPVTLRAKVSTQDRREYVLLDAVDLSRPTTATALSPILVELPPELAGRSAILELQLTGVPFDRVHFVTLAIDR